MRRGDLLGELRVYPVFCIPPWAQPPAISTRSERNSTTTQNTLWAATCAVPDAVSDADPDAVLDSICPICGSSPVINSATNGGGGAQNRMGEADQGGPGRRDRRGHGIGRSGEP